MGKKTALYYTRFSEQSVECQLCPHYCRLKPGQEGVCRARANLEGELIAENYGEISSIALDPVEKKPLYHFYPGHNILSIGSFGCNLACPWCQNYHIAAQRPETRYLSPAEIAELAASLVAKGSVGVAYTYNEPIISLEYVLECGALVKKKGLSNVLVTNGYVNREPLVRLLEVSDALNIDLKGFTAHFYRRYCRGKLEVVLDSIELAVSLSHVEITSLIVPGLNDDPASFRDMCRVLAGISPDIPWHLSAFYPTYRMTDRPSTPVEKLEQLRSIAREYMNYVYLGNVAGKNSDTVCPSCGQTLIERRGYSTRVKALSEGKCVRCGTRIPVRQ